MGKIENNLHRCGRCKEWKSSKDFCSDKRRLCGLGSWCRKCGNASHQRGYAANPKRYLARTRLYYLRTKVRFQERERNGNRKIKILVMLWYDSLCRCCG